MYFLTVKGNNHGVVCTWLFSCSSCSVVMLMLFSKSWNPNLGHNLTCHDFFSAGKRIPTISLSQMSRGVRSLFMNGQFFPQAVFLCNGLRGMIFLLLLTNKPLTAS